MRIGGKYYDVKHDGGTTVNPDGTKTVTLHTKDYAGKVVINIDTAGNQTITRYTGKKNSKTDKITYTQSSSVKLSGDNNPWEINKYKDGKLNSSISCTENRVRTYETDNNGNILNSTDRTKSGKLLSTSTYGSVAGISERQVTNTTVYKNGDKNQIQETIKYDYSVSGTGKDKVTTITAKRKIGKAAATEVSIKDSNDIVREKTLTRSNGTTYSKYDSKGNLVSTVRYPSVTEADARTHIIDKKDANGNVTEKTIIKDSGVTTKVSYNAKNGTTTEKTTNPITKQITTVTKDKSGKIINSNVSDMESAKDGKAERIYDEGNNLISETRTNSRGDKIETKCYTYKTTVTSKDKNGNLNYDCEYDLAGNLKQKSYNEEYKGEKVTTTIKYNEDGTYNLTRTNKNGKVVQNQTYDAENIDKNKNSKNNEINGIIDSSAQGGIGDCVLLSTLNALKNTNEGQRLLKDAITVNSDGSYTVTLNGLMYKNGKAYSRTSTNGTYDKIVDYGNLETKGDSDVRLLENAIESAFRGMVSNIVFDTSGNTYIHSYDSGYYGQGNRIEARSTDNILEALTNTPVSDINKTIYQVLDYSPDKQSRNETSAGKTVNSSIKMPKNTAEKTDEVNKLKGNIDSVIIASFNDNSTFKDAYGNDINLVCQHAYAIKHIGDDYTVIINPWDSSKDIVINTQDFMSKFGRLDAFDLSKLG